MISKKKKKRSSPKFRAIFLPISQVQTYEGGPFSYGGGYFPFFTENRPQKHKKHAFLHTSHAPPLATLLSSIKHNRGTTSEKLCILFYVLPLCTTANRKSNLASFRWGPPAHAAALLIRKGQVPIRHQLLIPILKLQSQLTLRNIEQQVQTICSN